MSACTSAPLAIRERMLVGDHPDTVTSLNNLALRLQDGASSDAARPLLERALLIRERVLGPDHPRTLATRQSLKNLLLVVGDRIELLRSEPLDQSVRD